MYRKDYILRMVEMFGEMIAKLLGLIKKGDYTLASKSIENAYLDFLQKEAAFFHVIPIETLTQTLLKDHNYTNNHLEILAELFNAEAELNYAQDKHKECLPFAEKALLLFEFINNETKTYSETRDEKIKKLNTIIQKSV